MNISTQLTYPCIGLAVFAQQLNLPVPAIVLLITIGALASRGQDNFYIPLVLLVGVVGCLAADGFWFWLGRRWGSGVIRHVCSFTSNPQKSRMHSHRLFDKWGLQLLLIAKFIPGLDAVVPPLAGAEGATINGFLTYDAIGSFLWTAVYIVAGFLFSNQLHAATRMLVRFETVLVVLLGVPLLLYVTWRAIRMIRMVRHLRLRRISPAMLHRKIDGEDRMMIVNLFDYEAQDSKPSLIPGAFRADPSKLRAVKKLVIPDGVDVVLYCSYQNEFVSARVAEAIK